MLYEMTFKVEGVCKAHILILHWDSFQECLTTCGKSFLKNPNSNHFWSNTLWLRFAHPELIKSHFTVRYGRQLTTVTRLPGSETVPSLQL